MWTGCWDKPMHSPKPCHSLSSRERGGRLRAERPGRKRERGREAKFSLEPPWVEVFGNVSTYGPIFARQRPSEELSRIRLKTLIKQGLPLSLLRPKTARDSLMCKLLHVQGEQFSHREPTLHCDKNPSGLRQPGKSRAASNPAPPSARVYNGPP